MKIKLTEAEVLSVFSDLCEVQETGAASTSAFDKIAKKARKVERRRKRRAQVIAEAEAARRVEVEEARALLLAPIPADQKRLPAD